MNIFLRDPKEEKIFDELNYEISVDYYPEVESFVLSPLSSMAQIFAQIDGLEDAQK